MSRDYLKIYENGDLTMKRIVSVILAMLMVASMFVLVSCKDKKDDGKYVVGVCQLVQHPALDAATQGFVDTLKAEFGDNIEIIVENASGEPATCTTIVTNFVSKDVDLIMANATPALQAAAQQDEIPVLGTSITEYGVALGIDNFNGLIGANVSGTSDLAPLDQQAQMIRDLFPDAQKIALLYCSSEANSQYQVKEIRRLLVSKGIAADNIKDYAFTDSNDVSTVAAKAAAEADVIYIPTDNTAASCAETISNVIGNTPVVAGEEGICKGCGVATLSINYYDLGVATAKMAIKILKGEADIEEMRIEYSAKFTFKYNAQRCEELGIDVEALKAKGYVAID